MPLDRGLRGPGNPYHPTSLFPLEFTRQQYEEWQRVCGQVTAVPFRSPLDSELDEMMDEIQQVMADSCGAEIGDFYQGQISDEQLREIVHQHYKRMCRLVDEAWHL